METEAARFRGPRTGKTTAISVTTSSADTNLTSVAGFKAGDGDFWDGDGNGKGKFICMVCDQDCQIAFGTSAVTIAASDPKIPANTLISFIAEASHIGTKAAAAGTLYIWPAS